MGKCKVCNKESSLISSFLSLCVDCIRNNFSASLPQIQKAHSQARESFNLPDKIPQDLCGRKCNLCVNVCRVKGDSVGFCGLPIDSRQEASLSWYYDLLPTNCVADWVCLGSQDIGYKNLAVFYNACNFDCLFCQNWHFRGADLTRRVSASGLADKVDERTRCICYFGGDPTPQLPHAILASEIARKEKMVRVLRICWETNGSMYPELLKKMIQVSLESDGCVKFDLKAWSGNLNIALCGITNKQTLENFKLASSYIEKRLHPPLIVASTLLVPGYVDIYEVEKLAQFIASFNPDIPYSLLAFHPQFMMDDLPYTSRSHAKKAKEVAENAGLKNVRIGNINVLGNDYRV